MRFVAFRDAEGPALGVLSPETGELHGLHAHDAAYPGDLHALIAADGLAAAYDVLRAGRAFDAASIEHLPPLPSPGKIICVGLNYADHSAESGFKQPDLPDVVWPLQHEPRRARPTARAAAHLRAARLGGRSRRRHRTARPPHPAGGGALLRVRLFDLQRGIGARLPVQGPAMDDGQELRRGRAGSGRPS